MQLQAKPDTKYSATVPQGGGFTKYSAKGPQVAFDTTEEGLVLRLYRMVALWMYCVVMVVQAWISAGSVSKDIPCVS